MHVSSDSSDGLLAGALVPMSPSVVAYVFTIGAPNASIAARTPAVSVSLVHVTSAGAIQPSRRVLAGEPREDRRITPHARAAPVAYAM